MKKIFASLLAFVLAATTFTGIAGAESHPDTLTIAIPTDENTITPYTYQTGYPGLELVNLLYDTLFQLDEKNVAQPWLVEDYSVSDDGLTYEFTLVDGVKWQDGEPLTANDVKFTVDYFIEYPKSRFTVPLQTIESLEVQDDLNFTMTLSQPEPNFMIQPLADVPILPEHIWSEVTNPDEATNALGSGPYKLVDYQPDQFYRFEANKDYFKGAPPSEELVMPIISDTTAMFTALKAGEIDGMSSSLTPEVVGEFESNPNLTVETGPGFSTTLFQMNAERYPMTETSFRQAVAYAIDTQYLVDTVTLGYAEVGSPGFIHPSSPFYNSDISFTPDMEKSKQLLEEAGFVDTNGDGFIEGQNGETIELSMLVQSDSPLRIRTAEIIAGWLNDAGISVSVKSLDSDTVVSLVWPEYDVAKGRDYDLSMFGWSSTLQLFPDRLVDLFHSDPNLGTVNIGGYVSAEFDEMANTLKNTIDPDERKQILMDMQSFVAEEFPIVTLYYQEIINSYNPNVYDGYVFQQGKGILNKLSFVPEAQPDTPAEPEETDSEDEETDNDSGTGTVDEDPGSNESGGGGSPLLVLGVIIVIIAGGIYLLKRKSSNKNGPAA
ncbi:ABC transporter substrate-binding protein [Bacillus fonticola]|uniref:ABC transporter substrate-binding protein n=1 Tax=Bacillus fonticola TaxID=2728853 RepID=UPI001473303B|nr:ABC transporter substrate-binding protein [Bacillus fonticola]